MNKKFNFCNWGDMGKDLTLHLFMSLSIVDVIRCGSVCRSWREASSDTELWKNIDLTKVDSLIVLQTWSDHIAMGTMNAIFRRGGDVSCLIFNYYFHMRDHYLIHVSKSMPKLKRLVLPAQYRVLKVARFEAALKNWPELESLTIPCNFPVEIMEVIGKHCKKFSAMKLMCNFYENHAEAVAAYLPNLKVLSLRCADKGAVLHILKEMKHLQVLNLSHSYIVNHSPTLDRRMVVLRELDLQVTEPASRLERFIYCRSRLYCNTCRLQLSLNRVLIRCRYEERVWRMDEVSSLAH
ncbi:PREDICTED: F-box/LRR-repeat protein At3g48880-like [Fragaria vesca subsp. vesca]|nr:PREDICTED: F-box/LRR-repeat protein At3g48880-like isoform X2 [Fragaria vesca subsp. vesca]